MVLYLWHKNITFPAPNITDFLLWDGRFRSSSLTVDVFLLIKARVQIVGGQEYWILTVRVNVVYHWRKSTTVS